MWRKHMIMGNVPRRFWEARLDRCHLEARAYAMQYDRAHECGGLFLFGAYGTGKTYQACAVLSYIAKAYPVRFATMPSIIADIQGTYGTKESTREVLEKYRRKTLLVIDDLGKEYATENAMKEVYELIDHRWSNALPTIVTTNHSPQELAEHFAKQADRHTAGAVMSRLMDRAWLTPIKLDGKDRRRM